MVVALLQAGHHGVTGDGAELIGEGAVEDQDVHGEDPLADGCGVLQDEALVDKENATWEKEDVKEKQRGTAELTVSQQTYKTCKHGGRSRTVSTHDVDVSQRSTRMWRHKEKACLNR